MKSRKKQKKSKKIPQTNSLEAKIGSVMSVGFKMPTADVVAAERASEAAYERELVALMLAEGSDSGGSDSEAYLRYALRPLQSLQSPPHVLPPPAATLLQPLAAALRDAHPQHVRFLEDYNLLLDSSTEAEGQACTDELMRNVEEVEDASSAGGVVLASWLAAAVAWRGPRVPSALPVLHRLLQHFTWPQVLEMARALHSAMGPRELVAVSDAVRGAAGRHEPAAPLLRAALAKLLGYEPDWQAGTLDATDLHALVEQWSTLDTTAQLTGLALTGRVLAGETPREASSLLAALAPPPRKDRHDPDYLKVSVAVKTLQNLFKDV